MALNAYQAALKRAITSDEEERLRRIASQNGQGTTQGTTQGAVPGNSVLAQAQTALAQKKAGATGAQGTGDWQDLWQAGPLVTGQAASQASPSYADRGMTGYFKSSDGNIYNYETAPDDVLASHGLMRYEDGAVLLAPTARPYGVETPMSQSGSLRETMAKHSAATPEQQALAGYGGQVNPATNPAVTGQGSGYGGQTGNTGANSGYPGANTGANTGANAGNPYQAYLSQWDYEKAPQWEGSEYQAKRDAALQRAEDMEWSYDPNTDPVYQAYQKQYRREGQRANQDTLGSYAAMTGGRPSSYAVTAASQAGDYYASQLADKIPELYNSAYQRYLQEFQRQLGISDQYAGFDDREYNRYADRLGQYNTDRSFDYNRYRDAVGDYRYDDETQYNRSYQAQRDAINDARYDQEWAQKLREYADEQGWKQKDWEQYLREYGDKLSEQEREWAYQQARDAVGDAWNERSYEDSRADLGYERDWNENERDYSRGRAAEGDARTGTQWSAAMEDAALSYLETAGYVTGTYAEILGVPSGTTREQYYAMYGVPYEQTPSYTPGYTPPGNTPPDDTGEGEPVKRDESGSIDMSGEGLTKTAASGEKGLIHKDGTAMTEGFRQYWPKIRDMYDRGIGEQDIGRYILRLYEQKVISEHEIDIILDQLGIGG